MVKKRKLCPQSVWDEAALQQAFLDNGVKASHIVKLHRQAIPAYVPYSFAAVLSAQKQDSHVPPAGPWP